MYEGMICEVCNAATTLTCTACKAVYYCSKEHQVVHWRASHKNNCIAYKLDVNDVLGRHLVAKRDIRCGEVILRESPIAYGPKIVSAPVCLGCHRHIAVSGPERDYYKCSHCNWPMCNRECETAAIHEDECRFLRRKKFVPKIDPKLIESDGIITERESAYCVILPLRLMLLKDRDPDQFEKFTMLEHHFEEWIKTPLYQLYENNLIKFFRLALGFTDWGDDDIMRLAGRIDTNSFDARLPHYRSKIRAVYYIASMFSHDCVPNTDHTFVNNFEIVFIATKPIRKGEILSVTYTQLMHPTLLRQCNLMETKHFKCVCRRCSDPSEMGTYMGSIACRKCSKGKLVSSNPINGNAKWVCDVCKHRMVARQMNLSNVSIHKDIKNLDRKNPKEFELFLKRYENTLHSTNSFILQAKFALTQLYGNAPGYSVNEIDDDTVARKIELCCEILNVGKAIGFGKNVFRGQLLLDLQEFLALQSKRKYLKELITREELKKELAETKDLLKECVDIFKYIPHMYGMAYVKLMELGRFLEYDVLNI